MFITQKELEDRFEKRNIERLHSFRYFFFIAVVLFILIDVHRIFIVADAWERIAPTISDFNASVILLISRIVFLSFSLLLLFRSRFPVFCNEMAFNNIAFTLWVIAIAVSTAALNLITNFDSSTTQIHVVTQMIIASVLVMTFRKQLIVFGTSAIATFGMIWLTVPSMDQNMLAVNFAIVLIFLFAIGKVNYAFHLKDFKKSYVVDQLNDKLQRQASSDSLTGLYNRRAVDQKFDETIRQNKSYYSVLLIDIDKFKNINDLYGHDCGDYALVNVVDILRKTCRSTDIIGRWGGEEFVVILPAQDSNKARIVAEKLRLGVEAREFEYSGQSFKLTITIGISYSEENHIFHQTLAQADKALLVGKKSGRNKVVLSSA